MEKLKGDWRQFDYRINSLRHIINGLENSISELKKYSKLDPLWSETFFYEEIEPIYGTAFIVLQNYVNSSIYDKFNTLKKKEQKYKKGKKIKSSGRTSIELIIGLANYFKHRDDNRDFNIGTSDILNDFDLEHSDNSLYDLDSPIFIGLDILSIDWKLNDLIEIVQKWRESLWKI